ncbi:MAG: V-type ATP synthase subunit D [Methylosarcina sp.]
MARLSYNKAALHRESARLNRFKQYLPSLDLKRRQLIAERYQASVKLRQTENSIRQCRSYVAENLPMLADATIDMAGLVKVSSVKVGTVQVLGNPMPVLEGVEIRVEPYSTFDTPPWIDPAVLQLKLMLELQIQLRIDQKRLQAFEEAVKKITQRVNLFDKVLIPRTEMNIKKIRIFLSDAERAAVIRAKMTKRKRSMENSQWPS